MPNFDDLPVNPKPSNPAATSRAPLPPPPQPSLSPRSESRRDAALAALLDDEEEGFGALGAPGPSASAGSSAPLPSVSARGLISNQNMQELDELENMSFGLDDL